MTELLESNVLCRVDRGLLEEVVRMTGDFPAPPAILTRLIELTEDPSTPVEEIAELLSSEPAVAARVLKQSNSAFYGRSRQINSVHEAVVMLGFYTIRSLVVATMAHGLYMRSPAEKRLRYRLWEHSLATAIACRMAARKLRSYNPEVAFIAGLLHDVGKLVMLERRPEKFAGIAQAESIEEALEGEMREFGFSHPVVGAVLIDRWLFPELLVEAVMQHHERTDLDTISGIVSYCDLFAAVHGKSLFAAESERLEERAVEAPVDREEWEEMLAEQKALFESA